MLIHFFTLDCETMKLYFDNILHKRFALKLWRGLRNICKIYVKIWVVNAHGAIMSCEIEFWISISVLPQFYILYTFYTHIRELGNHTGYLFSSMMKCIHLWQSCGFCSLSHCRMSYVLMQKSSSYADTLDFRDRQIV